MYFAISKFTLDLDTETKRDEKALKALCEKIRSRFKISVGSTANGRQGETAIVVAALAQTEERLGQMLNDIGDFCEESGFGRVTDEESLLDHIDAISEQDAEDD